jgi:hypothetical protein
MANDETGSMQTEAMALARIGGETIAAFAQRARPRRPG